MLRQERKDDAKSVVKSREPFRALGPQPHQVMQGVVGKCAAPVTVQKTKAAFQYAYFPII